MERHIHGRRRRDEDDRRNIGHRIRAPAINDHCVRPELRRESVDRFRSV